MKIEKFQGRERPKKIESVGGKQAKGSKKKRHLQWSWCSNKVVFKKDEKCPNDSKMTDAVSKECCVQKREAARKILNIIFFFINNINDKQVLRNKFNFCYI